MATSTTIIDATGTFTVPPGVTLMTMIEAIGAGVDGTASGGLGGGAGGGGGAWANLVNKSVTPGDVWTVTIDGTSSRAKAPGSFTDDLVAVVATGFTGGAAGSCTGDNKKSGGNGGLGGTTVGGGGGSAPSDLANANNGADGNSGGAGGAATIGTYINGGAGGSAPSGNGTLPGGGGAGGNQSGSTAGGTAGGGRVAFTWSTSDIPPPESNGYVRPIPGTDFQPGHPGGVLFNRIRNAAESPPAATTGMPSVYHVSTPSPPPFPGEVKFWVNPYGDPPPAIASGQLSQFKAETPSPPPYDGRVIAIRAPMGETPTPPKVSTAIHGMAEGMFAPEPGGVRHALATPFGLSALPARPMRAESEQPTPFPGGVIVGRSQAEYVRDPLPLPPPVVRETETIPPLEQPRAWSGTPAREAPFQQFTVREIEPPQYMGGVTVQRSAYGESSLPISRPVVVSAPSVLDPGGVAFVANRNYIPDPSPPVPSIIAAPFMPEGFPGAVAFKRSDFGTEINQNPRPSLVQSMNDWPVESGRAVISGGRDPSDQVPIRPSVVAIAPSADTLEQPKAWSGVPQRDAPHNTARVVVQVPSLVEPGGVFVGRPSFGIDAIPARPVLVREAEGTTWASPGEVRYSRTIEMAPVLPPKSVVISSPSVFDPGGVLFSRAEAMPSVRPITYLIAGETNYAPPSQPFFGWGWRTGTGAPPDPGAGYPVTLYGVDRSVITLTSLPDCEC